MLNSVHLTPGTLYVGTAPCIISTLVSSCVAVTMWSPRMKIGGMNHFLLPRQATGEKSPRYGETALSMLLARMLFLGCHLPEVEARIYGGASVAATPTHGVPLGEQNIATAWQFARAHALHVVDEQSGGTASRRLVLDVATGYVDVKTAVNGSCPNPSSI